MSDERDERFDANADYGVESGPFVRLDITPDGSFGRDRCAGEKAGGQAWFALTPDEARALAARLQEMARYVAEVRAKHGWTDAGPE